MEVGRDELNFNLNDIKDLAEQTVKQDIYLKKVLKTKFTYEKQLLVSVSEVYSYHTIELIIASSGIPVRCVLESVFSLRLLADLLIVCEVSCPLKYQCHQMRPWLKKKRGNKNTVD